MTPIEQKEIRGLNMKQLIAIFVGGASILISVVFSYAGIINSLGRQNEKLQDLKTQSDIRSIENSTLMKQLQSLEIRMTRLETQSENFQK